MDIKDILPDEECDYIDTCWYKMTPKDLRRLETSMYCTWNDLYFKPWLFCFERSEKSSDSDSSICLSWLVRRTSILAKLRERA